MTVLIGGQGGQSLQIDGSHRALRASFVPPDAIHYCTACNIVQGANLSDGGRLLHFGNYAGDRRSAVIYKVDVAASTSTGGSTVSLGALAFYKIRQPYPLANNNAVHVPVRNWLKPDVNSVEPAVSGSPGQFASCVRIVSSTSAAMTLATLGLEGATVLEPVFSASLQPQTTAGGTGANAQPIQKTTLFAVRGPQDYPLILDYQDALDVVIKGTYSTLRISFSFQFHWYEAVL